MTSYIKLSICIPSYNRAGNIAEHVHSILQRYSGADVEVVVIDNCSTDNTSLVLGRIVDSRFRLITLPSNIGGNANVAAACGYANGKWALLCLDKDCVDGAKLPAFLAKLDSLHDVAYGQVVQNLSEISADQVYNRGFDTLKNIGYNCEHPSGMFVRTDLLKQSGILDQLLTQNADFPFNVDIIKAHMAILGRGMRLHIPLIYTETLEQASNKKSHTYKGTNIWFFPENVARQAAVFINDLNSLQLDIKQKKLLSTQIYKNNLFNATFRYREMMSNTDICSHHDIESIRISRIEMGRIYFHYIRALSCNERIKQVRYNRLDWLKSQVFWWVKLIIKR